MFKVDKIRDHFLSIGEKARVVFRRSTSLRKARIFLFFSALSNILGWLYARYVLSLIDEPQIALHYNINSGIDFYGNAKNIYTLPLTGFIIIFFNIVLILITARQKDHEFIAYILLSAALLSNLILLISLRVIYLINFR